MGEGKTTGNRGWVDIAKCGELLAFDELLIVDELLVFGEVLQSGGARGGLTEPGQFGANARIARSATHGGAVGVLGGGEIAGAAGGVAEDEIRPDMIGLVADGLGGGVDGVGPTARGAERLGEGDAAPPVGGRRAHSLTSGGDGLLMTAETTQSLAGETVGPRPVPTERYRAARGGKGGGGVAAVKQCGGKPAPDLGAVGMGAGDTAQQGNGFASPAGGTQLGCSIEYVSERFDHRLCPPTSRTRQLGQVWQWPTRNKGTVLYRRVAEVNTAGRPN
nr:hypothetical protein [Kutzneria sp. 744]